MKTANHWNGAIYTDEFARINPNLTVFLFVLRFLVYAAIAKAVYGLYPEVKRLLRSFAATSGEDFFVKAFFRLVSFVFLATAVGVGVLDSIRSVSTSSIDMVSARDAWFQFFPASLAMAESGVAHYIHPEAWRWIEIGLSVVPAFAVLLGLSLLFWMAGYRKPRALGRFSA